MRPELAHFFKSVEKNSCTWQVVLAQFEAGNRQIFKRYEFTVNYRKTKKGLGMDHFKNLLFSPTVHWLRLS